MGGVADPIVARLRVELLPRLQEICSPQIVLLFGSRARGDALGDSDVDLLVVSEAFRGVPFLTRAERLLRELEPPFGIDLLCYTPEEFAERRNELGVVGAAAEEGIAL